jgi:hypothetical protein
MDGKNKLAQSEGELMDSFKLAANSVALLYRSGINESKKSYSAGYEQALQDVWEFLSAAPDMSKPIHRADLLSFLQRQHQLQQEDIQEDSNDFSQEERTPKSVPVTPVDRIAQSIPISATQIPAVINLVPDSPKRRWYATGNSGGMNVDPSEVGSLKRFRKS